MNNCIYIKTIKIVLTLICVGVLVFPSSVDAQAPGNVSNNLYMWLRADQATNLSGANVTQWSDMNGNSTRYAIQNTASSSPELVNNQINGNKILRFDGIDDYMQMNVAAPVLSGDCSVFVVVTPRKDSDVGYYLSTHSNGSDRVKFGHKLTGELTYTNSVPAMWTDDMHDVETMVTFQIEEDFYVDGYVNATIVAPWTHNFINSGANEVSLGQEYDGSAVTSNHWKGDVAEVIIFNRFLNAAELDQVHSYLNIRYGINIPVDNHIYFNHTAYPENIAGIGVDANQNLNQANSQSEAVGPIVRMLAPSNLGEDEYLVWGNDGAATATQTTEQPAFSNSRITREWRVSETGDVGTVSLSFDLAELGLSAPYDVADFGLLIDSDDGDFSNATAHTLGASINDDELTFAQVPFTDGDWFTLSNELGSACTDINLTMFLEGTYEVSTDLMTIALSQRGLLPGQTPISVLAVPTPAGHPYNIAPWNYNGTEGAGWTDADYPSGVVDWVLVSFRTAVAKNTEVARTAALLKKDGSIEFVDACVLDGTHAGPLHIIVEHRNHLAAMTPTPVNLLSNTITYDFGSNNTFSAGQKLIGSKRCLFAGDGDQRTDSNGYDANGIDKSRWDNSNGIFDQYLPSDFNLDGNIDGQDKSMWSFNNGMSTSIPR